MLTVLKGRGDDDDAEKTHHGMKDSGRKYRTDGRNVDDEDDWEGKAWKEKRREEQLCPIETKEE